jgi:hypothetical protein
MWLIGHALFHVFEFATGEVTRTRFLQDLPGVLGPALLVVVAFAILVVTRRIAPAGLPQRIFLRLAERLAPSESHFLQELAFAPGHALEKFTHFMPVATHRYQAEPDVFHLARLGATLAEDCGPCALTAAPGALVDGVSRDSSIPRLAVVTACMVIIRWRSSSDDRSPIRRRTPLLCAMR